MKCFSFKPPEHAQVFLGPLLWPKQDLGGCELNINGAVAIDARGCVVGVGSADDIQLEGAERIEVEGVLAPAFADLHSHWVQHRVMGERQGELLQWLDDFIYPAEAELLDPEICRAAADAFWEAALKSGTLCSAIFATTKSPGANSLA